MGYPYGEKLVRGKKDPDLHGMGLCVSEMAGALGKGKRKNNPTLAQANLVITRMDVNALPPKPQNQRSPSPPAHVKHKEMS